MMNKKDIKILTEILDLEDVKVISHRLHDGIGIILQTESKKSDSICPNCGTKSHKLHQNHRHIVKDLPFGEKPVFLEINRRQFKCEKCRKPFSVRVASRREDLDFVRKKRTYTKRLAHKTIQEVLENDIHSIASKGMVTTEEIERMLKDASKKLSNSKPLNLKRLGIDEIALVKGKGHYCAVLIDLDTSNLIAILSDVYDGLRLRTKIAIGEVLTEWGIEVLEQIEEVSIDLWQGYKNLVVELMPNAQVVADRFHVMTQINKELDTQIKREKRAGRRVNQKSKISSRES
jgi:transposase